MFVIFIMGVLFSYFIQSKFLMKNAPEKPPKIESNTEIKTETKIVYVPKETIKYVDQATGKEIIVTEKTDVEANIGKPTINVKINGKENEFKKSDDERFVFDKNKLVLDQISKITIETKIDPVKINNTKHWGIGAGYRSKKIGGMLTFPLNKKVNIDGWVYYNRKEKTAEL